jgi:integrase
MRLGELLGLEWGNIDWRARTINLSSPIATGDTTLRLACHP